MSLVAQRRISREGQKILLLALTAIQVKTKVLHQRQRGGCCEVNLSYTGSGKSSGDEDRVKIDSTFVL